MKINISELNKLFESRVRLGIMSVLIINNAYDFNCLKEALDVTDGNLASHLKALEENGLITVYKQFRGRKTITSYTVTEKGSELFRSHLKALEEIIRTK